MSKEERLNLSCFILGNELLGQKSSNRDRMANPPTSTIPSHFKQVMNAEHLLYKEINGHQQG